MERLLRIILVFFFVLVSLLAVLVGTVRFGLLNSNFVFGSLERNKIYEKIPKEFSKSLLHDPNIPEEERVVYSEIAASISPEIAKKIIKTNVSSVINYLNGKAPDVQIFISAKELGMPLANDIAWSSSKDGSTFTTSSIFYGIGDKIQILFFVLLVVLGILYKFARRVGILSAGIVLLFIGGVVKLFFYSITANTPAVEPSQVLLVFLVLSLFSDILLSWILIGAILIILWFILQNKSFFLGKIRYNKS